MTEYKHNNGDDYVTELIHTETQTAEVYAHIPYRHLRISLSDSNLINDGSDTVTLTITVVDGLEVARGTAPENASVLDYDGDVTLFVDGGELIKTLTNGSVAFDITTEKSAGSTIEVVGKSLADNPAESDSATIEVVSA